MTKKWAHNRIRPPRQMTLMELLGMELQHQRTRNELDALRTEARAAQVSDDDRHTNTQTCGGGRTPSMAGDKSHWVEKETALSFRLEGRDEC